MRRIHCNTEFEYQHRIRSKAQENYGKPRKNWPAATPYECVCVCVYVYIYIYIYIDLKVGGRHASRRTPDCWLEVGSLPEDPAVG